MQLICPSNKMECVPIVITDDNLNTGYIGGHHPLNIVPSYTQKELYFFASVPLSFNPHLFVSIFIANFEEIVNVRGHLNELGLLSVVVHKPVQRDIDTDFSSNLTEHNLKLLGETVDWIEDDDGSKIVRPNHKIGGRPHLVRPKKLLSDAINRIYEDSYSLIVQFDFPSGDDSMVSGNWPFGDGMFSLFGKQPFNNNNWLWYWDL
jgi:hypothetical protein